MKKLITAIAGMFIILQSFGPVFGQKSHGLEFDGQQYKNSDERSPVFDALGGDVPDSASVKQFAPKPLSQRMEFTSPGWAAAYGARTILEAKKLGLQDQKEITRISYSPIFNYHIAKPNESSDCSVPVKLPDLLESMKKYGVPHYMDFRKSCPSSIPDDIFIKAWENKISDYFRIFEEEDGLYEKVESVKIALSNGSPVVVGMHSAHSFETVTGEFWQPREQLNESTQPGQALVVVGYNDFKYTGAFEVMNSWGTDWGNDGFMWIRYKDFAEFTKYGFELLTMNEDSNAKLSVEVEIPLLDKTQLKFNLISENDGYYKTTESLDDDASFNLMIQSNEKTFVYIVGSDKTEEIFDVFPDDLGYSASIPYDNFRMVLTGGIDDTPGSNYLGIIISGQELEVSNLMNRMNGMAGKTFEDKFYIAFNDILVSPDRINFSNDVIKFECTRNKNEVAGVIIELLHD